MKQILQDMSKGATYIVEAPAPVASREFILIATRVSLISAGTERMIFSALLDVQMMSLSAFVAAVQLMYITT